MTYSFVAGKEIKPLIEIECWSTNQHYKVHCRECGELPEVSTSQSMVQAGLVRDRHLAEHLEALAEEIREAAR